MPSSRECTRALRRIYFPRRGLRNAAAIGSDDCSLSVIVGKRRIARRERDSARARRSTTTAAARLFFLSLVYCVYRRKHCASSKPLRGVNFHGTIRRDQSALILTASERASASRSVASEGGNISNIEVSRHYRLSSRPRYRVFLSGGEVSIPSSI